jgi:tRNA threonylcarbamoyladenosine biosynthesis protein TsaE
VPSPTFTLAHEYRTVPPLTHADVYRLSGADDLRELGLEEQRLERVIVVEWGEPYIENLGGDALVLSLTLSPREARFRATGPRSGALLQALVSANAFGLKRQAE